MLQAAELSALSTEGLFLAPAVESRSHAVRSAARVGLVLRHLVNQLDGFTTLHLHHEKGVVPQQYFLLLRFFG